MFETGDGGDTVTPRINISPQRLWHDKGFQVKIHIYVFYLYCLNLVQDLLQVVPEFVSMPRFTPR